MKFPEVSSLHVLWRKCRTCSCSCTLFFHRRSFLLRWPLAFLIFLPPLQNFMLFLQQKVCVACYEKKKQKQKQKKKTAPYLWNNDLSIQQTTHRHKKKYWHKNMSKWQKCLTIQAYLCIWHENYCTTWYFVTFRRAYVARPSIFVSKPSIFKSFILKQIGVYGKNIITHALHID